MRTLAEINNKLTMISEMVNNSTFQILEYENLNGVSSTENTININRLQDYGITLKQPRIILNDSSIKIQHDALSFMKGNTFIKSNIETLPRFSQIIFKNKKVDESIIKPIIEGTGEVFLDPVFEYFMLIELEDDEIIIDDNIFYACEEKIEISKIMKETSEIEDNEEIIQLKLKGNGIVLLKTPIDETEILRCKLYKDKLMLKDDLVILRTGNIRLSVEDSGNTMIRSFADRESKIKVYSGIGEVWIVPTKNIYNETININNIMYEKNFSDCEND